MVDTCFRRFSRMTMTGRAHDADPIASSAAETRNRGAS
jgi:hypothetical protein